MPLNVLTPKHPPKPGEPAWDIALLYPPQGQWTEEEYLALETNWLVELVDGCVEVLPMPSPMHQFIVKYLFRILDEFVTARSLGDVLFAPLPVRLWPQRMREPDIVFLKPGRIRNKRKAPDGADLVMEVVSEGEENRERDLEVKPAEYAKAKIAEYWMVDPQEEKITVLTLKGKSYRVHGTFFPGQKATSVLLSNFSVNVQAVFAAGNPQ